MSAKKVSGKTIWQKEASWRLDEETWRLENGRLVQKGIVQHPGSVVLVPLREAASGPEVIVIRQFRHALNRHILELPAGTLHWGEAPRLAAQRELREEIGYRAGTFTKLGTIWPAPGSSDEQMTLYVATELTPDPLPPDDDEEIELVPLPFTALLEKAKYGEIQDAKTIVGVWWTAVYLQDER